MLFRRKQKIIKAPAQKNIDEKQLTSAEIEQRVQDLLATGRDPVEHILDLLISQAILRKASDIHFEPHRNAFAVKYRIDGALLPVIELPPSLQEGCLIRMKVLSSLIVYKRDIPQDGNFKLPDAQVELRVTTFPTVFGEKAVIRIFDSKQLKFAVEQLGFNPATMTLFEQTILRPQGVVLLTGPANSGKTTTIYAAIQKILERKPGCSVLTLEDPVEYEFGNISQTQIQPNSELTYPAALRSILRQDPEVMLVGEIRDSETAKITMEAGLTGHLVLTTLHAGTAASVFVRLFEMGIEPFLLSSAISCVMNQRLVRKICPGCKTRYYPEKKILDAFGINGDAGAFYHGTGCPLCVNQGYAGRTVLTELVVMDDTLREFLLGKPSLSQIRTFLGKKNVRTLCDDGMEKAQAGITTLDEIERTVYAG